LLLQLLLLLEQPPLSLPGDFASPAPGMNLLVWLGKERKKKERKKERKKRVKES